MHQRYQVAKLTSSFVEGAALQAVSLDDGPGYYRLVRYSQRRTAGAAAANFTPVVYDANSAVLENEGLTTAAAVAAANPYRFPAPSAAGSDGEPGRYLFCPDGNLYIDAGGNVAGDTWSVAIVIQRIR